MAEEYKGVFLQQKVPIQSIFYLGELLVRKKGVDQKMYEAFEREVRSKRRYTQIALYEICRPENDSKRPKDYISIEQFWKRVGFVQNPELATTFYYKEIQGTEETPHLLAAWIKELS